MNKLLTRLNSLVDPVWTEISRLKSERAPIRILFTSTERGAGTTSVAAATAIGIARNLRVDVSLIEANLQAPSLAEALGLPADSGLSDVLDGRIDVEKAVRLVESLGEKRLRVLCAGSARLSLPGEFATALAKDTLARASAGCRYQILDAPPIFDHPETRLLMRDVDAAVLVLRAGSSRREDAQRAVRELQESNVHVIGTILNRVPEKSSQSDQAA